MKQEALFLIVLKRLTDGRHWRGDEQDDDDRMGDTGEVMSNMTMVGGDASYFALGTGDVDGLQ